MIIAFGATMALASVGSGWALTYHESYFAEPAREMIRTGDWVVPRMAGIPSWQKPPLTHWAIASTLALLRTEAEWAVRLPSLVAAILSALFVGVMAARAHGDRVGRLAGLIQLTTFCTLFQSRLAESDMPLCAAIAGAMLALALGTIGVDRSGWGARLAFPLATGASFLIKGPFGPVLIAGAAGLFALVERRRIVWKFLFDPIALSLLFIICLLWPIAAYRVDPSVLDHWRTHNVDRFTGVYDGQSKGPLFYFYIIPLILLPWTPLVAGGLVASFRDKALPRSTWRLMACWTAVGMVLISFSAWKHKHYPIPILPPASIVAAYALSRYLDESRREGRSPALITGVLLATGGVGVAIAGLVRNSSSATTIGLLAVLAGVGLVVTVRFRRLARPNAAIATLFGTVWLIVVLNQRLILPRYDLYRTHAEMARRVNATVPPGEPIHLVEVPHPQILFYLRHPMRRFDSWNDFTETMAREAPKKPIYVVGRHGIAERLEAFGESRSLDRASGRTPLAAAKFTPEVPRIARALNPGDNLRR